MALAAPAYAADLSGGGFKDSYAPAGNWAGLYIGANGGYAWSNGNGSVNASLSEGACFWVWCGSDQTSGRFTYRPEGGFGGGQIGYNFQRGYLVYGLEADLQGGSISGSGSKVLNIGGASGDNLSVSSSSDLDWFGTVRARLGFTVLDSRGLLYATGGFAYGGVKDTLALGALTAANGTKYTTATSVSHDETATGYTVGGGAEYAISQALSVKVEYQYIDLGSSSANRSASFYEAGRYFGYPWSAEAAAQANATVNHSYNTVRAGLNYHLSSGYEPLK
jgi:outer membrane immunogenic protein